MKKFRHVSALLMALVMVFSVFSINTFAADSTEIDTIALDFNAKPGDSFEDWAEHLTFTTDGVAVSESLEEYGVLVIGEEEMLTGTYEMGETYVIAICLEPEEGYSFPESAEDFKSVTVNGEPAQVYVESFDFITVSVTVTAIMYELAIGGTIDSVDASLNVYGDMAVADWYRYLRVNSQGVEAFDGDFDAVRAYDKNGNPVIGEFVTGEEYRLEVYLSAKKNCEFKKNEAGEAALDSVLLGGEEIAYTAGTYTKDGTAYEYLKLETTVTAKEPKYITSVDITLSENLEGMPVIQWEEYITINTPGLTFPENFEAVAAYDYFGNYVYDSFESGTIYELIVDLVTEEGYFIDYDNFEIKVNGEALSADNYYCYEDYETGKDMVGFWYEVDMIGDGFFAQLTFFFQKLINWFQNLFFGFILF